jgi:hypothetical protein
MAVTIGAAAVAHAEIERNGDLQVAVTGKLSPQKLPREGDVPVSVSVAGNITTVDGSSPPQLEQMTISINRHGHFDYQGLPICKISQIQPASNGRALAACRPALVGSGKFFGTITLPGSPPYPLTGRLLVFNGREHGHQVLLGHVYSPHPFATSFVISFQIGKHANGPFGTVLIANLSKALGKKKNLTGIEMTLSRRYSYRGTRHSYVSAACPAPKGVPMVSFPLAKTSFSFAGKQKLEATLTRTCGVR